MMSSEKLNDGSVIDLVDLIDLKIKDLQRMGVVVVKDPDSKPVVRDQFDNFRPVLPIHSSDSLTKIDLLCDQIRPRAKQYYDDLCSQSRIFSKESTSPFKAEQAGDRLMGILKFNIDE